MGKVTFLTDDPTVLEFLETLGRKKSLIVNQLILDCIEDGDGYVTPRIMAETGFHYRKPVSLKKSKSVKKSKTPTVKKQKPWSVNNKEELNSEDIKTNENIVTKTIEVKPIIQEEPMIIEATQEEIQDKNVANDNAPQIANSEMIFAGLASFGL